MQIINLTIITPVLKQLVNLMHCVASVRDQISAGMHVRHHVQDGGSADGTVEWLREYAAQVDMPGYSFSWASERDAGMYDALNRGVERFLNEDSSSDAPSIVAWLNCDEQYLSGAVARVAEAFRRNPEAGLICGDTLNLGPDGELICYRKNPPLRSVYVKADHLYTLSCATFFRREIFECGLRFDTQWKAVSDTDFILRVLAAGFRVHMLKDYISAFFMTGSNLSQEEVGRNELVAFRRAQPWFIRLMRFPINLFRRLEKLLRGGFFQHFPLEYSIYLPGRSGERVRMIAQRGSFRFRWDGLKESE